MARYKMIINTDTYKCKRCSKKNWEPGTLNDYMIAINGITKTLYDMPISATMVRIAMAKDNRKLWMSYVNPRLHKMYDELREELMTVEFYKNLAKE